MTSAFSWQNSISLCPASFCTPRPNLQVTPGASWLPTFAFQSPVMKRISFWGISSRNLENILKNLSRASQETHSPYSIENSQNFRKWLTYFWNDPSMSPRNTDTDKGEISIYVETMKNHCMSSELISNFFELIKPSKGEWTRPMNSREGEKNQVDQVRNI